MVFFLYRDILCIVGNILILIPFVDAIFFFLFSIFTKCKCITNDSRNLEIVILFFGRIFYKRYFCANA